MKILYPSVELTMVESRSRKSAFLREAVRSLGLRGCSVWTGRIEGLPDEPNLRGIAELVTVRAVKVGDVVLSAASYLLSSCGRLGVFGTKTLPETGEFPFRHDSSTILPSEEGAIHWLVRLAETQLSNGYDR